MNDHELDDQIRRLAQDYNDPPPPPREAMWTQIAQARSGAPIVAIGHTASRSWVRMAAGLAAVLIAGIGIGRLTDGVGRSTPTVTASANSGAGAGSRTDRPIATVAATAEPEVDPESQAAPAAAGVAPNPVRATREDRIRGLREERGAARQSLSAFAAPAPVQGVVGEGTEMSAYRLAVVEHMARAEVLLTSFLAESRTRPTDMRTAAQFASLSRDLLKTTRLLLATHSTDDPALTRLLEDLELVLMQISQYAAEGRRSDLDAINQSLDRRNVLPKLRSTIPAGASASSGT